MIEDRVGDIFEQKDLTFIAHQANLFHTFGSGIAAEIARRFPEALERDRKTGHGDRAKLGTYTFNARVEERPQIVNVYSQDGIGGKDRQTNYAAMGAALLELERELSGFASPVVGIPYKFGCGLANGDWAVVRPIIESAFAKSPVTAVICRKRVDPWKCRRCVLDSNGKLGNNWNESVRECREVCKVAYCRCDYDLHRHTPPRLCKVCQFDMGSTLYGWCPSHWNP